MVFRIRLRSSRKNSVAGSSVGLQAMSAKLMQLPPFLGRTVQRWESGKKVEA